MEIQNAVNRITKQTARYERYYHPIMSDNNQEVHLLSDETSYLWYDKLMHDHKVQARVVNNSHRKIYAACVIHTRIAWGRKTKPFDYLIDCRKCLLQHHPRLVEIISATYSIVPAPHLVSRFNKYFIYCLASLRTTNFVLELTLYWKMVVFSKLLNHRKSYRRIISFWLDIYLKVINIYKNYLFSPH